MPIIPALRRLRQEDYKSQASLEYIASSRPNYKLCKEARKCSPQSRNKMVKRRRPKFDLHVEKRRQ
jgi:hypothetical protein